MSKVAQYLQEHLKGEVSVEPSTRAYFSTDASTLRQVPQVVVSPANEADIRKVSRFVWQLAERGRILPMVARGAGTDLGGASIGQSIVLALQPHLNRILELDDKKGTVVVEPGTNFGRLQHMLTFSHARYIPVYPDSFEYSTIGGAIANNASGERSATYGSIANYVKSLRVVLANGEVIETGRLSKREVSKKMGLQTLEGAIYRGLDALLNENEEAVGRLKDLTRRLPGYSLVDIRDKKGSVDLTPLFVGAQGTLGTITQAKMTTEPYNPVVSTVVFSLADREALTVLQHELLAMAPLSLEYVDKSVLELARKNNKAYLKAELPELPAGVVVAEFSPLGRRGASKLNKRINKKLVAAGVTVLSQTDGLEDLAYRLKRAHHSLMTQRFAGSQLVPGIDDALVAPASIHDFMTAAEEMFKKAGVTVITRARLGEGLVHAYPLIDLGQLGDRQKLFRLSDDYYKLVMKHGGSVVGEHGEGRIRAGHARAQLGDVLYDLNVKLKQMFDPHGLLNPGVKVGVDPKSAFSLLRDNYEVSHLHHH